MQVPSQNARSRKIAGSVPLAQMPLAPPTTPQPPPSLERTPPASSTMELIAQEISQPSCTHIQHQHQQTEDHHQELEKSYPVAAACMTGQTSLQLQQKSQQQQHLMMEPPIHAAAAAAPMDQKWTNHLAQEAAANIHQQADHKHQEQQQQQQRGQHQL